MANSQQPYAASIDMTNLAKDLSKASGRPLTEVAKDLVYDAAMQVQQLAQQYAPRKTGNLAKSIQVTFSNGGLTAEVYPTASYAQYVEYDTKPHIIRPKKAKVLHFQVQGKDVFATVVHHPGTKAQPFMRPAAERTATALATQLGDNAIKLILGGDNGAQQQ